MFDDLIETIEDTFDDLSEGVKKLDKKKVFIAAAAVVGAASLFVWYRNRNSGTTEYVETVIAGNGAGDVPATGSLTADSGVNELVDEYNNVLSDLQDQYSEELNYLEGVYQEQLSGVRSEYDAALKESELYYTDQLALLNSDVAELEAKNEAMKKSIGSYDNYINYTQEIKDVMADGASGSSDKVSSLVIARASKIANEESKSGYRTDYDKNVDYMAAINKAKSEGASQEVIDTLTAQREAKIKGEQMTQYYGDLKKE